MYLNLTYEMDNKKMGRYYNDMLEDMRKANLQDARVKQRESANKMIWVTFKKEGIHKYPAALEDPKLATGGWDDVSFLGYPHRHIFHFRVWIEVFHDDRDIEFIQFKRWLERLYSGEGANTTSSTKGSEEQSSTNSQVLVLDYKSCEMISDELFEQIADRYPGRTIRIEVSEDGENGSDTTYNYERV